MLHAASAPDPAADILAGKPRGRTEVDLGL
jgi:hypothetical protein